jgi:hypothetical protein
VKLKRDPENLMRDLLETFSVEIDELQDFVIILQHSFSVQETKPISIKKSAAALLKAAKTLWQM